MRIKLCNPLHSWLKYLHYRTDITKIVSKCILDTFFVAFSPLSSPNRPSNQILEIACLFVYLFFLLRRSATTHIINAHFLNKMS